MKFAIICPPGDEGAITVVLSYQPERKQTDLEQNDHDSPLGGGC